MPVTNHLCSVTTLWVALLLAVTGESVAAQRKPACDCLAITSWTAKDGLPRRYISAIAQDANGFLWLGTDDGLVRFDGLHFVEGLTGGDRLPGVHISALVASRDGSLWIAFEDADGVSRIRDRHVESYSVRDGLPEGPVSAILEDRNGAMWIGARNGVAMSGPGGWVSLGHDAGLPALEAFSLYEDPAGGIWIGSSAGVFSRSPSKKRFDLYDPSATFVQSFAQDNDGTMWVTDSRQTVRPLRRLGVEAISVLGDRPQGTSVSLLHDRENTIWVAALGGGLFRIRRSASRTISVDRFHYEDKNAGAARSLFEDRDGNIWVGLRGDGLLRLTRSPLDTSVRLDGLTNDGVRAMTDAPDGSLWIATGSGLNRFHNGTHEAYPLEQTEALDTDRAGTLWAATPTGLGTIINGRFSRLTLPPLLHPERISSIAVNTRDDAWVCASRDGLFRWNAGMLSRFDDLPAIAHRACNLVYSDSRGRIWVGFLSGGAAVYDHGTVRGYGVTDGLADGAISAIAEDPAGAIWISATNGLSRIAGADIVTASARNGLPGVLSPSLVFDDKGYLWVGVDYNLRLLRFTPEEFDKIQSDRTHQLSLNIYDESDGLRWPVRWASRPAALRGEDGRLWFASSGGVTLIDPRGLRPRPKSLTPFIEGVSVDGRGSDPRQAFTIPHTVLTLQIDYSALALSSASAVRFRYTLEGLNSGWLDAGSRRQVTYTTLRPGSYKFRVQAANEGVWIEAETAWQFSVLPPFYRTYWFYTLCAAAAGAAVWAIWWLRLRAVRNEYALVIAERARLSREIHDTLLQSLGAFGLQLEVLARQAQSSPQSTVETLDYLRGRVGECIQEARRSIWALRSPRLDAHDIITAFREMAQNMMLTLPVRIEVLVEGRVKRCSPHVEEHLLRIGQEAINNAVTHGKATEICVTLRYSRRSVALQVSDNGLGFTPQHATTSGHWGLSNMKERTEKIHGRLRIVSSPNQGALIEATAPL
jgi:signal transduction histidine kinase/ligand-binding sensor domain-containing protein